VTRVVAHADPLRVLGRMTSRSSRGRFDPYLRMNLADRMCVNRPFAIRYMTKLTTG